MSSDRNRLSGLIAGPVLVFGGILGLWQNEGRFNYHEAAENAVVITSPDERPLEVVSYTGRFDEDIVLDGRLVDQFQGYFHVVRESEIYSWERRETDNGTEWDRGWYDSLDSNSRNAGLVQQLYDVYFYPPIYEVGDLEVAVNDIHFVDNFVEIPLRSLALNREGVNLGLQPSGRYFYLDKGRPDDLGDERIAYYGLEADRTMTYFGMIRYGVGSGYQAPVDEGIINSLIGNDGVLHHVVAGDREVALEKMEADFERTVWITRLVGTLVIVIGFNVFFSVFVSLLYRIPILGDIVEVGVWLVSIVLGVPIALVVILAGILVNNPFTVALPLALVVGGLVYFARQRSRVSENAKNALEERRVAAPKISRPKTGEPDEPAVSGFAAGTEAPSSNDGGMEETFVTLVQMALAEGELDKRENKFLVDWGRGQGISESRMKELFAEVKAGTAKTHTPARDDLHLMICVALADGVVSAKEWQLLLKLSKLMGVSRQELKQMLFDVEDGKSPHPA